MNGKRLKPAAFLWAAMIACILLGTSAMANTAETTTLGTRATLSQANPPISSNADARWEKYYRDRDYPRVFTYPLQYIDTRKGDKLAVLVSVPADKHGNPLAGRFPVILTQTAYRIGVGNAMGNLMPMGNTLMVGGVDKFMIRRGYVTVAVDVYGTGLSTGESALIGVDEQDAYADAVEWVTSQSWFDGNLGLAGTSYLGITTMHTASQQHSAVKAAFAVVPMGDAYRDIIGPGGLINANFTRMWLMLTQNLAVVNDKAMKDYPLYSDVIAQATLDHIAAIDSWFLPTIDSALDGETGYATDDGDFWSVRSPLERAKDINVPTFIIGANKDIFQRGEPLLYEQMKNNVTSKLLILPGAHVEAVAESALPHRNNKYTNGAPGSTTIMLQWFDKYLKGMDTGAEAVPNVTQYVEGYGLCGGRRFSTATDWPHPKASPLRFYLRGDMSLKKRPPRKDEPSHDVYEPEAPVVDIGVNEANDNFLTGTTEFNDASECSASNVQWTLGFLGLIPKPCYFDNTEVEEAQNALVFETKPMKKRLYINGPMMAEIWMSATNTQAALAVRIDDVDKDGKATPISSGIQSAAMRAVDTSRSRYVDGVMVQPWHPMTAESAQPLTPGTPVLVPVEIFPAAALIRRGHKLRIAISSSNQVMGIWPLPMQAEAEGNVSTIYNDPEHPSSLVVLSVPPRELR